MVNCTLKNDSYCQYTFSYKLEDWTRSGPETVFLHLDEDGEKGICPTAVKIDYFGMIIGGISFKSLFYNIMWLLRSYCDDRGRGHADHPAVEGVHHNH